MFSIDGTAKEINHICLDISIRIIVVRSVSLELSFPILVEFRFDVCFYFKERKSMCRKEISLFGYPRGLFKDLSCILKIIRQYYLDVLFSLGRTIEAIVLFEGAYIWMDLSVNPAISVPCFDFFAFDLLSHKMTINSNMLCAIAEAWIRYKLLCCCLLECNPTGPLHI